jgi:bifunctional UDP-N-acetylglucosamine pyrophosphorylase/glucosamine-1-phosphate N-acetyltransferase
MIEKAVILAAGVSSRFWPLNKRHKSLIKVMGKPLIFYTLEALKKSGIQEAIIIQGPKKEIENGLKEYNLKIKIKYFVQKKSRGMGDALWMARNLLKDRFLVINSYRADIDEIIQNIRYKTQDTKYKSFLVGQKTETPELFGIMKTKGDRVLEIIEKPKRGKEPSNIKALGVYILNPKFFDYYKRVKKHAYDFEDALSLYMKENKVKAVILKKEEKNDFSLKYPWHLFKVERYLFDRFLKRKTEKTAKIEKGVEIKGNVYIGKNVTVYKNAVIKGPCYIGDNCIIGNNAIVREYANLEKDVLVGANSEVTRSIFQENVHTHSNFIGDSILGKGSRIGAGTVTANVRIDRGEIKPMIEGEKLSSGLKDLGCIMGENAKVGINCSFMPGVLVGSDCVIGPGSLVIENIKDNTRFYTAYQGFKKVER